LYQTDFARLLNEAIGTDAGLVKAKKELGMFIINADTYDKTIVDGESLIANHTKKTLVEVDLKVSTIESASALAATINSGAISTQLHATFNDFLVEAMATNTNKADTTDSLCSSIVMSGSATTVGARHVRDGSSKHRMHTSKFRSLLKSSLIGLEEGDVEAYVGMVKSHLQHREALHDLSKDMHDDMRRGIDRHNDLIKINAEIDEYDKGEGHELADRLDAIKKFAKSNKEKAGVAEIVSTFIRKAEGVAKSDNQDLTPEEMKEFTAEVEIYAMSLLEAYEKGELDYDVVRNKLGYDGQVRLMQRVLKREL